MLDNAKVWIKNNKKTMTLLVVLVLTLTVFVLYKLDYRLTHNFSLGKTGEIRMAIPYLNTEIFIDESDKIVTEKENQDINLELSPKKHTLIISKDGFFPWKKEILVESRKIININPFFVSENASGQVITRDDPEYFKIRNTILTNQTPTKENPLKSADGKVEIWIDDNAIMLKNENETIKVIQPDTIIRNLFFYKERSDVVMFSTSGSVFAMEIDEFGGRNFMPIYRGQKPEFIETKNDFIYVLDGDVLMFVLI